MRQLFAEADVLCMTVDGFNQAMAGRSTLSGILTNVSCCATVLDEAQNVSPNIIAAIACWTDKLHCFFDRAQYIVPDSEDERHKDAGGLNAQIEQADTTYQWTRAIGGDARCWRSPTKHWDVVSFGPRKKYSF